MTLEEKDLLLKDICARLPYMPKIKIIYQQQGVKGTDEGNVSCDFIEKIVNDLRNGVITDIQIYLRPMSSMTEEEKKELQKVTNNTFYARFNYISNSNTPLDGEWHVPYNNFVTNAVCNKLISWLDEKHFDHRTDKEGKTLIEKGLALEAPEGMYK